MESCMKPIAKAMTLACCAVTIMTAAQAASDKSAPLSVEGQRAIVPTMNGFVILASDTGATGGASIPPTPSKIIRIGADVLLDARLFMRPSPSIEENSHARR